MAMMMVVTRGRPLSRFFVRLAIRLFRGVDWAHSQEWWPYLEIERALPDRPGRIIYRGREISQLFYFGDMASGRKDVIYIIGSGPSVADCNLAAIGEAEAVLLNGAISLATSEILSPFAIAIEDERFVWRHFSDIMPAVSSGAWCMLSTEAIRAICENDLRWLDDKRVVLIDDIRRPYRQKRIAPANLKDLYSVIIDPRTGAGFSHDPALGVFKGGSVVVSVMQFAVALKPRMIGLVGIDISNANQARFYEREGSQAFSGIVRGQSRIVSHLELAKACAEAEDIMVENFSERSILRKFGFCYSTRLAKSGSTSKND